MAGLAAAGISMKECTDDLLAQGVVLFAEAFDTLLSEVEHKRRTARRFAIADQTFALALSDALRVKQGIFRAYRNLSARLATLVERGEFLLTELLRDYRALQPALHTGLHSERLAIEALGYVVARLPGLVTRTTFYYLTTGLPPLYEDPDDKFEPLSTQARRRAAWGATPAKAIVLLRDGTTDITRTIAIGTPSAAMRRHFTSVLKGHIAIATARFPKGTRGVDLDPALWTLLPGSSPVVRVLVHRDGDRRLRIHRAPIPVRLVRLCLHGGHRPG